MFKCTECEKIYDIKPDYCDDCGNDVFEEIVETTVNMPQADEVKPAPQTKTVIESKVEPEIEDNLKNTLNQPETQKTVKVKELLKKDFDYLSWGFLGICILISLLIIFFAFNPSEEELAQKSQNKPQQSDFKPNNNIPTSVDSFWNNELPKVQPKPAIMAPPQQAPIQQPKIAQEPIQIIQKQPQPVQNSIQKPVQTAQKQPQTQPKQQTKTILTKPAQQPKQVQPTQPKPVSSGQKPTQTTQTKPAQQPKQVQPTQPKPAQQTTQPVWQAVQQPAPVNTPQTVDTTALKKELTNYKINLRNTIGRKIDFANVIGDGSCTVAFKIDSSGKLINRSFSQQSTNTTLNDAVYSAVMATPSYNPPPSGYKNETLYLKISFYNGNFQISLN